MEGPRDRREKAQGFEVEGGVAEAADARPDDVPTGPPDEKPTRGQADRKVKLGLSVPEDFSRRLGVVSASLGLNPGDLVVRVVWPMLRSCHMPKLSNDIKARFPRESAGAK